MSDRELDRKVAEAMGCAIHTEWKGEPALDVVRPKHKIREPMPCFSTDFAALPELLAWLQARAYEIEMHWNDTAKRWGARTTWNDGQRAIVAATLPEAVCNLVLAVSAKEKP